MIDETSSKKDDVIKDTGDASVANQTAEHEAVEIAENVAVTSPDTDDSASAETQLEELNEALLRSQADLQNSRRRAERDIENAHKYAVEKFVKDLLAVIDSMDRALELATTTDGFDVAMLEGTQMTHKLLLDTISRHGVEPIDPAGEPFDPQQHQAMSMVESEDQEPNTVMAVMQKGYTLEGRVIRAAMVVVTKAKAN
ncbi:MAG TPA: nucleotide exchange factor GrpE [Gammaproteobacteria bacterium]|nr:nucleotide exchange factor GrpE [Gammaproteobacteria bacterium]